MSSNLKNDGLVGLKNGGLVGLQNDGLVGLQNNGHDRDGLAMVVDDNCEFTFEGRSYWSYTDYVQARQSLTAGIFADSGMLAARSAIAEERTAPGPRRAKNPRDDLVIPPLLPQRKSSRIARTVSKDYDKGIDLAGFIRSDVSFGILRGLNENRPLYPPNSRISDFRRRILIFVHNFVPTDDISITPECFFTLGKSGKPNQSSWIMPFRVLGKCMRCYNPGQFIDVDAAVGSTVEQTIQTNCMFFGGVKNWCDKRTDDLTSYNDLAQLTDSIGQIFHGEDVAIVIWGNKITNDVSHPVRFHASKEVARRILTDTKKWPQDRFGEVDWEHLDLAMSSKSDMYKIWRSKQHSGFCGTRVQVGKYSGLDCPDEKCPNCGRRETAEHILICRMD
jgi:hypothetical protein